MSKSDNIEAKAAEWLVRRDIDAGGDQHEFAAWLAADPRHRATYLRLAAAWSRTTQMKRLRPEGPAIDPDLLRPKRERRWSFGGWKPLSLAAAIAVVTLAGVFWVAREPNVQTYRTDIGGLSRVILSDGSAVTLNTDTEIKVHMLPKRRQLTLTRGEAQFSVAHDVSRPFEVSAGGRIVRAVGTAFDVRLGSDSAMQVIVTEGRVAIETARASDIPGSTQAIAMIAAGEAGIADGGHLSVHPVSTMEASRKLAWQTGELSFQGETLGEVVTEFNRYNRRKLKVEDPAVAALQVGGNFQALDIDSFVVAVQRSFNLVANTADDGTLSFDRPKPTGQRH